MVPAVPKTYRCFCGKLRSPVWDPRGPAAHTCGDICGRGRSSAKGGPCKHRCDQLCHAGPCPPCPVMVPAQCHCKNSQRKVRCSTGAEPFSCGKPCDALLACGKHRCRDSCHAGPCVTCSVDQLQACYCGATTRLTHCGTGTLDPSSRSVSVGDSETVPEGRFYSCGSACGQSLDCGKHRCEQACHAGPCKPCAFTPERVTTCPCGHMPLRALLSSPRTSCTDGVPTCRSLCRQPLPGCGHACAARCHAGPCPPCEQQVTRFCRCGHMKEQISCVAVGSLQVDDVAAFVCRKQCGGKLNCGRHRCDKVGEGSE